MIRGFRQIAGLTLLSRVLGMVRDILFAAFLGRSGWMDIWVIAFKIPNLSRRIFGEGALSSSLMPVYMQEWARDPRQAGRLGSTILTVLTVVLSVVVLLASVGLLAWASWGTGLETTRRMLLLTTAMLPYTVLICLVAAMAALLQAHRHFAAPAAAPVVLNLSLIGTIWVCGRLVHLSGFALLRVLATAVLVAGVAQLALQGWAARRVGLRLRPAWSLELPSLRRVLVLMGPMVLGLTVTQVNTLADDVIAKTFSGSPLKGADFSFLGYTIAYPLWDGAVAGLFFAQRLYQFPLGVLGISLGTALFPVMNAAAAQGDHRGLARVANQGLKAAVFVALPATVGMVLVAVPLVGAIFQTGRFTAEDTEVVARILRAYALGLGGYFLQQIVTRTYYAVQDSVAPFRTALWAVGVNVVLNLSLIWWLDAAGLALATALCSYLQVTLLTRTLRRRFGSAVTEGLWAVFGKTCLACLAMAVWVAAVLVGLRSLGPGRTAHLVRLAATIPAAVGVYLLAARGLGMEQVGLLWRRRGA